MEQIPLQHLESMADALRVLSHPQRLRIIELLDLHGPQPVHELQQHMGINRSTLSNHISTMRRSGLIDIQQKGKEHLVQTANPHCLTILNCIRSQLGMLELS